MRTASETSSHVPLVQAWLQPWSVYNHAAYQQSTVLVIPPSLAPYPPRCWQNHAQAFAGFGIHPRRRGSVVGIAWHSPLPGAHRLLGYQWLNTGSQGRSSIPARQSLERLSPLSLGILSSRDAHASSLEGRRFAKLTWLGELPERHRSHRCICRASASCRAHTCKVGKAR